MSLVTLIRDYVDVANGIETLDSPTLSSLAYHTVIFLVTVTKQAIVYCFTFHWIRDFSYFCFTPPSIFSSFTNVGEIGRLIGVFTNDVVAAHENQPFSHLVAFSDLSLSTGIGIVFLGFLNGCFSCLHLSAAHLVTIRRMLVQGAPAGLCAAFGTALGQFLFLACIFFGFRGLLLPWLSLEPLQFLVGTGIILSVASNMAQDRRTPTIQWSAKSSLSLYVCINAALAWCEQAAIFQWVGNLSFGAEPTFLESTPSSSVEEFSLVSLKTFQQLAQNSSYLLAFFLGSVLGASLLAFFLQRLLELVLRYKRIAVYYGLIKQANLPLATLIFAFGFGSIPYYGLDYLVTKGLGFVPQEKMFRQTLFSPINLVSKTAQSKDSSQNRLEDQLALFFTLEGERSKSFAVDTTPFDDGQYLKSSQKRPQAFEDLNYRGEHLWTNRLSRISNIREQANQTQSSFLGPVFSWMRSFLWGDEPTTVTNQVKANSESINSRSNQATLDQDPVRQIQDTSSINSGTYGVKDADIAAFVPLRGKNEVGHKQAFKEGHKQENKKFYSLESNRKKELSPEMEQNNGYLKEFDRYFDKGFSNFYDTDPHSLIEVEDQWQEKRIKEKCYTNPIYKFLLNTEIDAFLGRQPKVHWLSPQEEIRILKRRQLLGNYYDTLALTNQVSTSTALEQLVPKSYANSIYNHQFKGTLKTARRLFSVKADSPGSETTALSVNTPLTFSANLSRAKQDLGSKNAKQEGVLDFAPEVVLASKQNIEDFKEQAKQKMHGRSQGVASQIYTLEGQEINEQKESRVIKFDQPLFSKEKNSNQQILFHEELSVNNASPFNLGSKNAVPQRGAQEGVLGFARDQRSKEVVLASKQNIEDFKEQAKQEIYSGSPASEKNIFLLEQAESTPLYAGWDEELRKFVLTNRYQNRAIAGYTFSQHVTRGETKRFSENDRTIKATVFTTWPIPNPRVENISPSLFDEKVSPLRADTTGALSLSRALTEDLAEYKQESATSAGYKIDDTILPKVVKEKHKIINQTRVINNSKTLEPNNHFLFQSQPITNDMVNALLQWQKLIKENKQLSREDKQVAKETVSYWPDNIRRANWSNELMDSEIEFEEPTENVLKKKIILWEFTPPSHGGFIWSGNK